MSSNHTKHNCFNIHEVDVVSREMKGIAWCIRNVCIFLKIVHYFPQYELPCFTPLISVCACSHMGLYTDMFGKQNLYSFFSEQHTGMHASTTGEPVPPLPNLPTSELHIGLLPPSRCRQLDWNSECRPGNLPGAFKAEYLPSLGVTPPPQRPWQIPSTRRKWSKWKVEGGTDSKSLLTYFLCFPGLVALTQ